MDRNKKRKLEEEAELSKALRSFEDDFGSIAPPAPKAFVRGDVVENNRTVSNAPARPTLYKPAPIVPIKMSLPSSANSFEDAKKLAAEKARRMLADAHRGGPVPSVVAPPTSRPMSRPQRPGAKGTQKSKTSNLDAFKEELKRVQEERDKRKGLREHLKNELGVDSAAVDRIAPALDKPYLGSGEYDDDPYTTNLYVCNLPLDVEMSDILDTFGSFGPLASAKILYPRTDEEKRRDHLCGFVAFMCRTDADRAISCLQHGLEIRCEPIKMSFARPVVIPMQPFYVPPCLEAMAVPDPPTGLPFNAKPLQRDLDAYLEDFKELPPAGQRNGTEFTALQRELYDKMMKNATVRVVIPTDSHLLQLIHRVIEFVIREGPIFEAMLMAREMHNQLFRFLFDNDHPAHVYYRWKMFSILQGDDLNKWRMEKFRMFSDGSWWEPPPPMGELFKAMPKCLYYTACNIMEPEKWFPTMAMKENTRARVRGGEDSDDERREREKKKKNALNRSERNAFEDILRTLTPEKDKVGDAMIWCAEHASCAQEICETIYESLTIDETPLHKKVARVYLISDILANCAQRGVKDIFFYRQYFEQLMTKIFVALGETLQKVEARLKAEQFKQRIMLCFRAWEDNTIYPTDFLIHNQNLFLGLVKPEGSGAASVKSEDEEEDIDGAPIEDDIDGMPISDDVMKKDTIFDSESDRESPPPPPPKKKAGTFKAAAWNDVTDEPQKPLAPASKWDDADDDRMDTTAAVDSRRQPDRTGPVQSEGKGLVGYAAGSSSESDGEILDRDAILANAQHEEERRKFMRDVEVKVMAYQDDLEAEKEPNIKKKVEEFRKKEMKNMEAKLKSKQEKERKKEKKKDKKKKEERKEERNSEKARSRDDRGDRKRDRSRERDRSRDRRDRSRDDRRDRDRRRSPSRDRDRRRDRSPERRRR